jgi:hypothetical protein
MGRYLPVVRQPRSVNVCISSRSRQKIFCKAVIPHAIWILKIRSAIDGSQYVPDCNDIAKKSDDGGSGGVTYCGTSFSDGSSSGDSDGFGGADSGGDGGGDGGGCGGGD